MKYNEGKPGRLMTGFIRLGVQLDLVNFISNLKEAFMLPKPLIKEILTSSKPQLSQWGVCEIGIFGSSQRDQMTAESDIDILVDFEPDKETYLNFIATCNFLEAAFSNNKLEIVSKNGLSPFIGPHILKEVEYV